MEDHNPLQDEELLIDDLLGRLEQPQAEALQRRLENEPALCARRDSIANALAALDQLPQPEAPKGLAERTLAHIAQQTALRRAAGRETPVGGIRPSFSLREAIAIAGVIVILASILVPSLRTAGQRSQWSRCEAQAGRIGSAMQAFAINNNGELPRAADTPSAWLADAPEPSVSNSAGLFKLLRTGYLKSPTVFQCPSQAGPSFAVEPNMTDFPKPEHVSYSYQHAMGTPLNIHNPSLSQALGKMVILADQTPVFAGGRFNPDRVQDPLSDNHDQLGQSALYLDGHVKWVKHANVGINNDNIFLADDLTHYTGTERPANATDSFLLPAYTGR